MLLPTLTTTIVQASLACGACLDGNLLVRLPFLGWWMLLFVGWSLLVGPLVFNFVNAGNATDLRNPARLFLWLFGLLVASLFLLEGSFVLPFVLLVPFWITALVRGIRCQSSGWRQFCLLVVGAMVLLVPVSYALPGAKRPIGHGDRIAPQPAEPTARPAAPTLQDALPTGKRSAP